MSTHLSRENIDSEIRDYFAGVNRLKLPSLHGDVLTNLLSLKRAPLESGPYPKVSLFEASNRILSDMIVLLGIRSLLRQDLPYSEYVATLGNACGPDITATSVDTGTNLVGEAFNVARTFFPTKCSSSFKKLNKATARHKVMLFNADARPAGWSPSGRMKELIIVQIDVIAELRQFSS